MVYLWLSFLLTFTTLFQTEAKVEWISRPRSRLFVNAGETAEIKWRFPPGAKLITYKKKSIQGDEVMIASKQGVGEPEMFNATESVIRVERSGALSILKAGLKDEGFYEIAIAYNKGITLKDEVEIKIQEAPVITTFPSHTKSEVFYVGMTINLVCMAKGRPVPQVQWFKDESDQPLQKSSGSILHHIKSASKEDSGRYTCLASNQAGKVIRSIEYIILRRPYDIDFVHNTALDGTIYEGESVRFMCSAKGNPPITYYKLLHNGKEIDKSSSGKYIITEVRHKNNGTYCCIPINRAGLGENRTVVLKVKARPSYWEKKLRRTTLPPTDEEEWQEPNEFYLHHLPLLQEAVEHVSTKVTALKAKVEMAAEKHKKTASHNKIQQRRQAKRAKLHAIINVTEGSGDDCHVVETSDCDGADNDSVVVENDVEEL